MIYCISDIHGEYDKFIQMLGLIGLRDEDTLYVLGDVFDRECDISEYALYELVWARPDYDTPYFDDINTVSGHTPTPIILGCDTPGKIFKKNNFVVIDCGAAMGGQLGCLRLDDMAEFYV